MKYETPPDIPKPNLEQLKRDAAKRRKALVGAGCSTYALGRRAGAPAIQCLCCGLGSSSWGDIENKYCGFCEEFHSEWSDRQ